MSDRSTVPRVRLTAELVALCERPEPRLGPEPGLVYYTPEDFQVVAERLLAEAGDGPLWVFAYGSLLWRPAFDVVETRLAKVSGWRRNFCMEIRRWRGSPDAPGLMMGLREGGHCKGLVLKIAEADRVAQLVKLLRRETDVEEDLKSVQWIEADTAQGKVRALACWAEPVMSRMFVEKPIEEQAHMLARACGSGGSGAHYLHQTVTSLARLGLEDEYLNALDELVALEIIAWNGLRRSQVPRDEEPWTEQTIT
jgi:glutathione-specific gamma-glutamylcyclotransferase